MPFSISNLNPLHHEDTELIQINVNGSTDGSGNVNIYTPESGYSIVSVFFTPQSGSYDGLITPFISVMTGKLYLHCANWSGAAVNNITLKGTCNILLYKE